MCTFMTYTQQITYGKLCAHFVCVCLCEACAIIIRQTWSVLIAAGTQSNLFHIQFNSYDWFITAGQRETFAKTIKHLLNTRETRIDFIYFLRYSRTENKLFGVRDITRVAVSWCRKVSYWHKSTSTKYYSISFSTIQFQYMASQKFNPENFNDDNVYIHSYNRTNLEKRNTNLWWNT